MVSDCQTNIHSPVSFLFFYFFFSFLFMYVSLPNRTEAICWDELYRDWVHGNFSSGDIFWKLPFPSHRIQGIPYDTQFYQVPSRMIHYEWRCMYMRKIRRNWPELLTSFATAVFNGKKSFVTRPEQFILRNPGWLRLRYHFFHAKLHSAEFSSLASTWLRVKIW